MESFEATARKRGKSLGITIPRLTVRKNRIRAGQILKIFIYPESAMTAIRSTFGTPKQTRPTQEILDEMDAEEFECEKRKEKLYDAIWNRPKVNENRA